MGTSVITSGQEVISKDHPHAYGDKSVRVEVLSSVTGSSPRVWGQVCKKLNITVENRIIPTRMGTSLS